MTFSEKFYKATAACAALAALLMLAIWVMDFLTDTPGTMEDAVALVRHPVTPWFNSVCYVVLFFNIMAFWGVTAKKMDTRAGLAITAFIFAGIDIVFEFFISSLSLGPWAEAVHSYQAADAAMQATMKANLLAVYWGLYSAAYMVAVPCLLVSMLLYGLATWRGGGVTRLVSIFFFLAFINLAIFSAAYVVNLGVLIAIAEVVTPLVFAVLFGLIAALLCRNSPISEETAV